MELRNTKHGIKKSRKKKNKDYLKRKREKSRRRKPRNLSKKS